MAGTLRACERRSPWNGARLADGLDRGARLLGSYRVRDNGAADQQPVSRRPERIYRHARAQRALGAIVDDVNCSLLSRGCSPADTDVFSHQVSLSVLTKTSVRCYKSAGSQPSNLTALRELRFALCFVGTLSLIFVERHV